MGKKIGPPRLADTFWEVSRTTAEFWASQLSHRILKAATPDGFGQPVLVLPGLGGNDLTTTVLRKFLTEKNYSAYGWEHGINTGPSPEVLRHLKNRLDEIHAKHGQKVALIGHSLGGIYARELARAFPDKVSMVMTLGSPFGAGDHLDSTAPIVRKFFEFFNGKQNAFSSAAIARQALIPPPVPTTSLYTQYDGIVNWRTCINPRAQLAENVEVYASHCGLVMNPVAMLVIADRLSAEGGKRWRPFEIMKYGPLLFPHAQAHHGQEPEIDKSSGKKALIIRLFPEEPS